MAENEVIDDMGRTTIQVSDKLADDLHDRKSRGDSYEDVIWRALDQADGEGADTERGREQEAKA